MRPLLFQILLCVVLLVSPSVSAFTHPGLPLTVGDLETLKAKLNTEPWKSGYAILAAAGQSQLSYTMAGPFTSVSRTPDVNLGQWKNDMQAVYNLARMGYFTGNSAYSQKAHDILIAYARNHQTFDGAEMYLSMGDYAYQTFSGADILRGTWPGWTQADTDACKVYFENVWWHGNGINIANPLRSANQGILQLMAVVGVAVFNDDDVKFAQCLQAYRADINGGLPDSLSNGQIGDSGRDQGHAYGELQHLALIAEIFWKQGVDVYSEANNRLLAAGEFYARYNLGVNTPYIPFGTKYDYYPNHGGAPNSSAKPPDMLNLIHNAYVTRKGLLAPYISQYRETRGENADSFVYRKREDSSIATVPAALTIPAANAAVTTGFSNIDIGTATPAGGSSYSNGTWTVTGAGTDIWGGTDSYHFTYKQLLGDFTFVAKVTSLQNTHPGARAALVMRDSLSATATRRVYFGYTPGTPGTTPTLVDSHQRGYTANSHNDPDEITHDGVPLPQWLKLQRIGTRVLVFHSDDGANWIPLQYAEYADWTGTSYVGLGVCSRVNGTLTTATFSDVRVTGGDGNEAAKSPVAPRFVYAAPGYRQVPLRWLDAAYATSYNVKRATNPGGPYTILANVTKTSFVDLNVLPATNYYYVVSSINAVGPESGNSPEETVTTLPLPGYPQLPGAVIGTTGSYGNNPDTTRVAAVDGDIDTSFDAPTASGSWVGIDLGSPCVITRLRYVPRDNQQARMIGGMFQASNSATFASGVVTLHTIAAAPPYNIYTSQDIADPAGYRYVRYLGPTGGQCNVAEIEFYGFVAGSPPQPTAAPTGLSLTALSPREIQLAWTSITATPGYYLVKRSTSPSGPYAIIGTDLAVSGFRDTGILPGMAYYYVISFDSVGGESPVSAAVTLPPAPHTPEFRYWDTTIAAGLANGSGTWDTNTTALWSDTTVGTSNPLNVWLDGDHAFFQTGGILTATISGTVRAASVTQAITNTTTTINGATLQLDSAAGVTNSGNKNFTIDSAVVLNSPNIVLDNQTTAGSLTLGGLVGETGGSRAITKNGPGNVSFKSANTFSGGLAIIGGQVSNGANNNLTLFGTGPITLASNTAITGGNRTLYVANTGFAFDNAFIIQTGTQNRLEYSRNATLPLNGTVTGGGLFQISTGFNPTIQFNGDLTAFTGTLQFVGNGGTGAATSNYDFTNSSTVGAPLATIRLETAIDSTHVSNNALIRWNPATTTSAIIPLGALAGNFGIGQSAANLIVTNAKAGTTATWKIGGLGTNTSFTGIIQDGSGTSSLTKTGAGSLVLTAAQSYTGPTVVESGLLELNGSLSAGSSVTIKTGGTLGGTGAIPGNTILESGGTLAPGSAAAGTLVVGSLVLNGSGMLALELATPAASDKLTVSGTYTAPLSGTVILNVSALGGFGPGTYPLITGAAGISASGFKLGSSPPGQLYLLEAASGTLSLVVSNLAAPAGLTAIGGVNQISLEWLAVSGATGYEVRRSTVSGSGFAPVAAPSGNAYADPAVPPGIRHFYQVAAVNDFPGPPSAEASAISVPPLTPAELAGPGVTLAGNTASFTLAVSVVGRNYQLQRSPSLAVESWENVGLPVFGTGVSLILEDPARLQPHCFYRVLIDPS